MSRNKNVNKRELLKSPN